ncbi:MAG: MMPL family transporter [Bacteroidota bacterium]|nr:MMPL family transporter [Bacteroidota bacterium]
MSKLLKQVDFSDKITVLISPKDTLDIDRQIEIANVLVERLDSVVQLQKVQAKVDQVTMQRVYKYVNQNLPLYLEEDDYQYILNKLSADSIEYKVNQNLQNLISPSGIVLKDIILLDPLGLSVIGLDKLQKNNGITDGFSLEQGYLISKKGQDLMFFLETDIASNQTDENSKMVKVLNDIKQDIELKYNDISVDYYGASFVAEANSGQIKNDIFKTVLISFSILLVLMILYFRKVLLPLILFLPIVLAGSLSLMIISLLKDYISAISLGVSSILIGVTIDYSIHILTHYKRGSDIKTLYDDVSKPLIISSLTTSVAFLSLLFVNSEVLQDLGLFSGLTVFFSAIFSLVIIPLIYKPNLDISQHWTYRIVSYPFEKNKILVALTLLLIIGTVFTPNKVKFDGDLSKLNYVTNELKEVERRLDTLTDINAKSIYLIAYGEDKQSVLEQNFKLYQILQNQKQSGEILQFTNLAEQLLPLAEQQKRIDRWNGFWSESKRSESVSNDLIKSGLSVGFEEDTHSVFYDFISSKYTLEKIDTTNLFHNENLLKYKDGFYTATSLVKLDVENKASLLDQINGATQNVFVLDRKELNEQFLFSVKADFERLVGYSFVLIIVVLWLFFRRIELVILSITPIVLTGLVVLGLINWLNLEFNVFSSIVVTLIFGHGVDFAIFMTVALQKAYTYGKKDISTYKISIVLAVLTTILAIGTLIFAQHPALKSISAIALLGILTALLITFVVYPLIFRIFIMWRDDKGLSPISLRLFLHSMVSFLYYGAGAIILSFVGRTLAMILPGRFENKMLVVRQLMSKFLTSVLYSNWFVSKKIQNPNAEYFQKPVVLISNHNSFLDSLTLSMTHYKIIFLVNDWVYNSVVFGKIVKAAGFYPVSQGVEDSLQPLKQKVEQGYSLMVFPEGKRSEDNQLNRFHKGAFYLAEQLQLDILPVYVHGNSELIPKGDYIIYDGSMTVRIGSRISQTDVSFGNTYKEKTKGIYKFFKKEYQALRYELEDEDYFKEKLFLTYRYKERDILNQVKEDFRKNKSVYYLFFKLLSQNDSVYHLGNDFGQLDFMILMQEPRRLMFTYIVDSSKRAVAKHNYWVKKRKIHYIENTIEIQNLRADTMIISTDFVNFEIPKSVKRIFILTDKVSEVVDIEGFVRVNEQEQMIQLVKDGAERQEV